MKTEQMELMKVIEFPKDKIKEKETRDRLNKLDVACHFLKNLVESGHDFHIVVNKEAADELFKLPSDKYQYATLTSNFKEAEMLKIYNNTFFYPIQGDEV